MMSMCAAVAAALMPPLYTDMVLPTTAANSRPATPAGKTDSAKKGSTWSLLVMFFWEDK